MSSKISALSALSSLAIGDLLNVVDISDTTMGAGGTNKKVLVSDLLRRLALPGTDITAASTTDLSTATGAAVTITGNTTITGFGTVDTGVIHILTFSGTPVITYNATSLKVPTSASITAAAGDVAWIVSLGSGNWKIITYQRADGTALTSTAASTPTYSSPSGMRLSTESGVPLSIGNRTSQGTLYLNVDRADYLLVPNTGATDFDVLATGQLSLSLTMTSGKNYDVFCWNNSGTPTLLLSSAWTDDATRADALGTLKGIKVNNATIGSMGAKRGIWLGTIRASGTNVTEISNALLGVWNKYNQCPMPLAVGESTVTWTYNSATWRQVNGTSTNKIQAVIGERQSNSVKALAVNSNASGAGGYVDIGVNSTTTGSATIHNYVASPYWAAGLAFYEAVQEPGFYSYNWLESVQSGFTVTFVGYLSGSGNPTNANQTGIFSSIMG